MSQAEQLGAKINLEMLACSFHLVANLVADSSDVAAHIMQRTNLVDAMVLATENKMCCEQMLGTLVWLASSLVLTNQSD